MLASRGNAARGVRRRRIRRRTRSRGNAILQTCTAITSGRVAVQRLHVYREHLPSPHQRCLRANSRAAQGQPNSPTIPGPRTARIERRASSRCHGALVVGCPVHHHDYRRRSSPHRQAALGHAVCRALRRATFPTGEISAGVGGVSSICGNLHDDPDTTFALLFVDGDGCYEVLRREPMLASRLYAHHRFGPLTPAAVLCAIPTYHSIDAEADPRSLAVGPRHVRARQLPFLGQVHCHGTRLCQRTGRTVRDEEIGRTAFGLSAAAVAANRVTGGGRRPLRWKEVCCRS